MTVQTIPPIEEMTPAQRIELMEALWKSMDSHRLGVGPPDWHGEYLRDREKAIAEGTDEFVELDEFESELRRMLP
jgi:hypothetical protein